MKLIQPFYDLAKKDTSETKFFFLEHVLKARKDLHFESGRHEYDQEVNVYLAGLLHSLIESGSLIQSRPYISAFDADVREYLSSHPGAREAYNVYRENADFALMLSGLFHGYAHSGSYHHIVLQGEDSQGKIAVYYELAGSALLHLHGSISLVYVFTALSENTSEVLQVLRKAAGSYFDLMDRLTDGSEYHLQHELTEMEMKTHYREKLDLFLAKYAEYKENPEEAKKKDLLLLSDELEKMNEKFKFDKGALIA